MVLDNSICNRSDLTIQSFETLIDEITSAIHLGWGSSQLCHCQEHAPGTKFEPLVEVCTPNATLQLELCGIKLLDGEWSTPIQVECQDWDAYCESDRQTQVELRNTINTISMMSKAMATKLHVECEAPQFLRRRSCQQSEALVAIDTLAHGVLSDLLSATGNNMDITWPVFWIMGRSRPCKTSIRSWATIPTSPCHLEDHFRSPRNVGCLSNKLRLEPHYGSMSVRYLKDYLGSQPLPTQLLDCTDHVAHLTHMTENWIQLHVIKLQHTAY